jgi:two-component system response regulator MprA
LVVEDSVELTRLLELKLGQAGYEVHCESDGYLGLARARRDQADLVILDRNLPGLDGLEICKRVREALDVPILMLTAAGEVQDRVDGLESGANDYLPKPFAMDELLARVKAQLRSRSRAPRTRLVVGDLSLDTERREVRRGDRLLALTPREFELLGCLMENAGRVMTRDRLIEKIWGYDFDGEENVLEVFIRTLRTKVEQPGLPKLIHTRRGVGYVVQHEG